MGTALLVVQGVLMLVGGASILVKLIAPLTKTKVDDKAASLLDRVKSFLEKLALNGK